MKKTKTYKSTRFGPEILRESIFSFRSLLDQLETRPKQMLGPPSLMKVHVDRATWLHDDEIEFLSECRRSGMEDVLFVEKFHDGFSFSFDSSEGNVSVSVEAPLRREIETVFDVFDQRADESRLPEPTPTEPEQPEAEPPTLFIGHGRSRLWRDLKDHLQDDQGFKVEAYEIGARAGHAIRDVLEDMLRKSSMAFLVMTGEDETVGKRLHPRLNVVHEAGLFQGRLGFKRAIILLEDGAAEFSNIAGIEQIRFPKDGIREAFGDVVATVRREFPGL